MTDRDYRRRHEEARRRYLGAEGREWEREHRFQFRLLVAAALAPVWVGVPYFGIRALWLWLVGP